VKGGPQIALTSLPGTPPALAREARARAWAFVFQCWQEKKMAAGRAPAPDGRDAATRVEKK